MIELWPKGVLNIEMNGKINNEERKKKKGRDQDESS